MKPPKQCRFPIEPFRWEAGDPLAAEHELVSRLVSENLKRGWQYYKELELEVTESGKTIIKSDPEAGARMVSALVAHAAYFDGLARKAKALARSEYEKINWHHSPEFEHIWPPRQVSAHAVRRVLRRKLPLTPQNLKQMAEWIAAAEWMSDVLYPLKAFIKAMEAYGPIDASDSTLRELVSQLARRLRTSHEKGHPKLAQQLDVLLSAAEPAPATPLESAQEQPRIEGPDSSMPAPVGSANVLVQLKQLVKTLPADNVACTEVGNDHFPLRADSPFRDEHELINILLNELIGRAGTESVAIFAKTNAGQAILARDEVGLGKVLLAITERCINTDFVPMGGLGDYQCAQSQYNIYCTFRILLQRSFTLDRNGIFDVLLFISAQPADLWTYYVEFLDGVMAPLDRFAAEAPFSPGERHVLHRLRCQMVRTCPFGRPPSELDRVNRLIGGNLFMALVPGEAWSDAVNAHLAKCPGPLQEKWLSLLQLAATATASRPSGKWLKTAKENIADIGNAEFVESMQRWLPLVNVPRTVRLLSGKWTGRTNSNEIIQTDNATCLRGLLWMSPEVMTSGLIRVIGALTASCFRKVPGVGPRAPKVGNAGIYALSQINDPLAVGQLALLKVKVKSGSAQKEIEKAFNAAAERSGLPREELEELSVPTYGLTGVGVCEEEIAGFTARLKVTGTNSTELEWLKPDGKVQRAVPAAVKAVCKDDLKDLQAAAKDIEKMLPAQRERIDSLFLQQKTWPAAVWRDRYLNHPLVGTLARRILWDFKNGETTTCIWFNGRLVDFDLKPVELSNENTTVQLWHPIGKSLEEVKAWRDWLGEQQIQQPFKQAHREVYLLTDAERNTRVYSNRYAAHVIRQHQFNALCALRGWKNKLRLMVDDEYPAPSLTLPQWGLRAEFWVEGLGTDYGTDTNDSGVYLYLSTDQVRFYRTGSAQRTAHAVSGGYHPGYEGQDTEPLSLEEIPALVFSEVMRDVDLFVGVGSVGNDPAWADGGPQGRYRDYWQRYSFGELNASAKTRREVLERLVPKLKIAGRCSFLDRFLVVKGALRTYKIHLGSGNILMEPNDQYLCVVPKQGDSDARAEPLVLPFEGDRTLSVILSKAFMLAEDSKIIDPTILSQIKP